MFIIYTLLSILIAYILGSLSFALIIGKGIYGIDLREHGSGNLGGTNTFRVLGASPGLIVMVLDLLKGTFAASLPFLFGLDINPLIVGAFAILGHSYSIFANLQGGKAVATTGGVLLLYDPILFSASLFLFFVFIVIFKYVSLSSILTGFWSIIYTFFYFSEDYFLITFVVLFSLFIVYKHRTNISRIINGSEPKVDIIKFLSKFNK